MGKFLRIILLCCLSAVLFPDECGVRKIFAGEGIDTRVFMGLVSQKYFPFESVSFDYTCVVSSNIDDFVLEKDGVCDIFSPTSFRARYYERSYSGKKNTGNSFHQEIYDKGIWQTMFAGIDGKTGKPKASSIGEVSYNKHYYSILASFWMGRNGGMISDLGEDLLKNAVFETCKLEGISRPVVSVKLLDSSVYYFYRNTALLAGKDEYTFIKNPQGGGMMPRLSGTYRAGAYHYKDGFYFPETVVHKKFGPNQKEYVLREYRIDPKSLRFNSADKKTFKMAFPNGCNVNDKIKGKTYVIGETATEMPQKEDIIESILEDIAAEAKSQKE